MTGQVTLYAVYPNSRDLLAYPDLVEQGFLPHKVKEVFLWGAEQPNYHADITETFELKIAALRCHKSQIGNSLSPELAERMKQRYKMLAEGTGYELAEAFYRVELFR